MAVSGAGLVLTYPNPQLKEPLSPDCFTSQSPDFLPISPSLHTISALAALSKVFSPSLTTRKPYYLLACRGGVSPVFNRESLRF